MLSVNAAKMTDEVLNFRILTYLFPHFTCINRKIIPSRRQTQPTTMYAMPRKGFFPPNRDVVDKIILFVPSNLVTI
jgi:hypothetical protein